MKLANVSTTFPAGTVVGAYVSARFDAGEPSPIGPVLEEAAVAEDGSLTFSKLAENGSTYAAAAKVNEVWRVLRFTTAAPADITAADLYELLSEHTNETTGAHGGIVASDDPRLEDQREPLPHADSHKEGGEDEITPGDIGAAAAAALEALAGEVAAKQDSATAATDVELGNEKEAREAADALRQLTSEKGQANGYASLEAAGKVPVAQLPSAIMEYQGTWNANTNTPALADGAGNKGDVYRVSVAGERNLGSGVIEFAVGDYVIYNGATWEKSDTTDAVASVAGKKGAVTLTVADLTDANTLAKLAAENAFTSSQIIRSPGSTLSLQGEPGDNVVQLFKSGDDGFLTANKGTLTLTTADGLIDVSASRILDVGDPVEEDDAATKGYADTKLPVYNVKAYGAKGDGATDDSTAIQAAIDAAAATSGIVYFPLGTYIINATLTLKSKVHLLGAGPEASTLKLKNNAKQAVIKTANYGAAGIRDFSISSLSIDGNKANNTEGSGILIDGQKFLLQDLEIHHCDEDGLGAQMTEEKILDTEGGDESVVRNVRVWLSGVRNLRWAIRDGHLTDVICIHKDEGATLTNILIDTNGFAVKMVNCHAWGKCKYAYQVKGEVEAINCSAEGAVTANVIWEGDNSSWIGGRVFKDGSENGKVGFVWATGKGFSTVIDGVRITGCTEPFVFTSNGAGSKVSALVSIEAGKKVVNGAPSANEVEFDIYQTGAGTVGNAQKKRRKAPEAGSIVQEHLVDGDTNARYELRADGLILFGPGNAGTDTWLQRPEKEVLKVSHRFQVGVKYEEVASANTITVKDGLITTVKLTGSTEVKKINATSAGHVLVIILASTAKLVDGENLKLKEAGPVTADDTITLVCDGTNWFEVGRSVN